MVKIVKIITIIVREAFHCQNEALIVSTSKELLWIPASDTVAAVPRWEPETVNL
jgi:hypothetical protein